MTIRSFVLIMVGLGIAFLQPVWAELPGTIVKHVNYEKKTITLELYRRDQGTRVVTVYNIEMGCAITLNGVTVDLRKIHRGQHVTGMITGDNGLDGLTVQN